MAPLTVTVAHLPRLPTDQTAAVMAGELPPAIDVLLPLIPVVQRCGSSTATSLTGVVARGSG